MQQGTTLPGVETDDEDRIVVHVDLDCFYAACERLREPELAGEPVVVGMGYDAEQPSGAVATASYEAREHGVESAQAISTAMKRLPRAAEAEAELDPVGSSDDAAESGDGSTEDIDDAAEATGEEDGTGDADPVGYYRPVDMEYYESIAAEIKKILHDCAETVREVSIDEAYLDVTDRTDWSVVQGYARHVKQRIDREVGLTASVGVAPTMHAAKVASDHDKPDGLVVVEPGEVREFLAPLPIDELHGIGPVTARTLREHGVETVADLADADREWVREQWGDRGLELHERARGIDPRVVEPRGRPKSLSRESSLGGAEADFDVVEERIRALAEAVADRAHSKAALYRTIGIKVVLPPFDVNTRARSLPGPVDDPALVEEVALDLLTEFEGESPRKVGVRVSNLSFAEGDQSTLGGWDGAAATEGTEAVEGTEAEAEAESEAEAETEVIETDGVSSDHATAGAVDPDASPNGPTASESEVATGGTLTDFGRGESESAESSDLSPSVAKDNEGSDDVAGGIQEPASGDAESSPDEEEEEEGEAEVEDVEEEEEGEVGVEEEFPGQSVLDRVWSDGPAEHADPEPIGQPPDQTTLSEFE